jgi:hypothetical protein
MPPITSPSEFDSRIRRRPWALAHAGESALAYRPTRCFSSDSRPTSSIFFLGLGRPLLHQPHREHGEQEELQVLRLPVLRDVDREVGRRQVAAQRDRLQAVGELLVVEVGQPGDRLADQGEQEEQSEREAEGVLPEEMAHGRLRPTGAGRRGR